MIREQKLESTRHHNNSFHLLPPASSSSLSFKVSMSRGDETVVDLSCSEFPITFSLDSFFKLLHERGTRIPTQIDPARRGTSAPLASRPPFPCQVGRGITSRRKLGGSHTTDEIYQKFVSNYTWEGVPRPRFFFLYSKRMSLLIVERVLLLCCSAACSPWGRMYPLGRRYYRAVQCR